MADSNITKKALASALKKLMEEKSFSSITISDICEICNMNRKSFYYHFKDKYDLVNWIFDTEFLCEAKKTNPYNNKRDFMYYIISYFYDNRRFYKQALEISGQNSLMEHFEEIVTPVLKKRLQELMGDAEVTDFQIYFMSDAFFCTLKRWLLDKNCIPPDKFLEQLESCICCSAGYVVKANAEKKSKK